MVRAGEKSIIGIEGLKYPHAAPKPACDDRSKGDSKEAQGPEINGEKLAHGESKKLCLDGTRFAPLFKQGVFCYHLGQYLSFVSMASSLFCDVSPWEQSEFDTLVGKDGVVTSKHIGAVDGTGVRFLSCSLYSKLTAKELAAFPDLEHIVTRSTGFDHIDMKVCQKRGIKVSNTPSYGSVTVAEHVFALILGLSRHVHDMRDYVRRGSYMCSDLMGFDLKEKTMGIVGAGLIGKEVARIAHGFGMNVLLYDVRRKGGVFSKKYGKYVSFETLLSSSDIVSLHVPGNEATKHLIDQAAFAQMKDGVVLINTSRGSVVDSRALAIALDRRKVGAAGLDVIEGEHALWSKEKMGCSEEELALLPVIGSIIYRKNVLYTPHTAFFTEDAVRRRVLEAVDCWRGWKKGKGVNVVCDL